MLFRQKLFKRSNQYIPHQLDEVPTKMGKAKRSKIFERSVQVLKVFHTVKNGSGIGQHVFHSELQPDISADQRKSETKREICALTKAKLICLERNTSVSPKKSSMQIYNDKRTNSQNQKNMQYDHPAFKSSLFMGVSKKENKTGKNRKFGDFKIRKHLTLQSIQECEDEDLYDP